MKKVSIIGGGIIGLCSAYYLAKEGYQVVVFDKSDMTDGCSYGNAGMIVPSHIIPLAQPGMITQGIKWMFDSQSPFYVKPRLSMDLANWGLQFYKHANKQHVEKAMPALCNLSLFSKELYQDFIKESNSFFYEKKGLLMLYKTEKTAEEINHEGKLAECFGLEVDYLSKDGVTKLETGTSTDVIGGVHYKSDAHIYPQKFMQFIKDELSRLNVKIHNRTTVEDFVIKNNTITEILTDMGPFMTDEVVLACGSWSPKIAKKLNRSISILPGKGYSFTLKDVNIKPSIPAILCEGKVAVTPMNNDIRFGGTMEITHTNDTKINKNRVQGIVNSINEFYPDLKIEMPKEEETWYGFRPCTPSGMPIIARDKRIKNLTLATGHAMMGLSLAPATGKIVSEIISGKNTSVNTQMFQL
ncbi:MULTISPECIES: FAD-binding oxidoreductase [unclassified Flavobacterium]|uniref:NAD(P)/FAD-dependent oxidoreductase n=1 Tax=unclassified Flavobacterium TaxID=196869 RepID=UPI00057D00B3|nr:MULTISPECIES: FAD-dependent oxidoreductase [unclassified Flavobacterium]KIA97059.1 amino acid dehydrogenase [Flavobacterium sp. KMS]KIC01737.1 amino acid dehydrogenase [Flavobacterium sp. JRM]MEA9414006.1 FAD-dependent oxidoreductase [Flavobacterium sp. PL02]OUL62420.1 amino acid dehydrogenase [Flavobacterium sp. AJR]